MLYIIIWELEINFCDRDKPFINKGTTACNNHFLQPMRNSACHLKQHTLKTTRVFGLGILTAEILSEENIQLAFHSAGKISVVLSFV